MTPSVTLSKADPGGTLHSNGDPDYAAHERRSSLPGYIPAVCVVCSAALQVPSGTTVPMRPGCEEQEREEFDSALADRFE